MAELLRLRLAAGPVADGASADFTVVAVAESVGDVITPGVVGATTLFTVTEPAWLIAVRLLGTVRIEGSTPGWRRVAGESRAAFVFTLTATGEGDPVEATDGGTVRNNGDPVGPVGSIEEVWVGTLNGNYADFSYAVAVSGAQGDLVLEGFTVEVSQLPPPGVSPSDTAVFVEHMRP